MGYTTQFEGIFTLNKKLTPELHTYLNLFNRTRRMKRNLEGWGIEGEFYVLGKGFRGQVHEDNVIDRNRPASTQPGLWCQWRPTKDGLGIEWDEGEKFYNYIEWLKYIIKNFLAPNGYILRGQVNWSGEEIGDNGRIIVINNKITTKVL